MYTTHFHCYVLYFVDTDVTEMFRLLRNVFQKAVHIVNSFLILTSDVTFSQSDSFVRCCNS
jgi:hypothetical protein